MKLGGVFTRMFAFLMMWAAVGEAAAQTAKPNEARAEVVYVFVNVNVVPMDKERILEKRDVVVRDGRIDAVGPTGKVKIPKQAVRIDAKGKYLMPGLVEMHGHLPHPATGEKVGDAMLFLFAANGVTTVRGMFGFANHLQLRERVARGKLLGPKLYVASPAMSGMSVQSVEAAKKLVREYKQAGYDLLKVHEGLQPDVYDAIAVTAKEVGIRFGGHVSDFVGLKTALASGQITVDHIDNFVEELEAVESPIRNADPQTRAEKLHQYLDERKIPELVKMVRESGVWSVPTMALWETIFSDVSVETLNRRPELKYVPKQTRSQWEQQRRQQLESIDPAEGKRILELRGLILKALQDGGANVTLGSDAPQLYSVPGFSLLREMESMARTGLTPYQILAAGTRNPARYFGTEKETGTVEKGKVADLILVNDNPLRDVANVSKRSGVMLRGRWLSEEDIQNRLREIAADFAN